MDETAPDLAAVAAAAPETAIDVITDPRKFFAEMPREGGLEAPATFAAVMLVAYAAIMALLALFGFGLWGFFGELIGGPILGAIGLLIGSGILLLVSRALGGEATFESSFRIVAYASALAPIAAVASLVPYLPILVDAYGLYVAIVAVIAVHKVPEDKAWRILGGIGAVLLVLSLLFTMGGRRAARDYEEIRPELEKWSEEMERNSDEWRRKMEEATEEMRESLERRRGRDD